MSILTDYNGILDNVQRAISDALKGDIRHILLEQIRQEAYDRVYTYGATPWAMSLRRYEIGDDANMDVVVGENYIRITNNTQLQHGGADESDVVEGGWENYRQPGPRPFMNEALNKFVDSGEADRVLQSYLRSYGVYFD